jgi:hypothetical protein
VPKLINTQSGTLEEVSHDDLQSQLNSGLYELPADAPVGLKTPEGELIDVDPNEAYRLVSEGGYSFPSSEEVQSYSDKATYGDDMRSHAKSFMVGAAKGVPFVGGALARTMADEKEISARERMHPGSMLAGELASLPAMMLLPEGAAVKAAQQALKAASLTGDYAAIMAAEKALEAARIGVKGLPALNPMRAIEKAGVVAERAAEANKILNNAIGKKALGSAVEGALYSAGQLANEYTIGDPYLNGEQAVASIGFGAAIGGLGGALLNSVGPAKKAVASKLFGEAEGAATKEIVNESTYLKLSEELSEQVSKLGLDDALPAKNELEKALKNVPMEIPIHPVQIEALKDEPTRKFYKTVLESNTPEGNYFKAKEAAQKKYLTKTLSNEIESLSEAPAAKDWTAAGDELISAFDRQYKEAKEATKKTFQALDEAASGKLSHPGKILDSVEMAIPGSSDYLNFQGVDGKVTLAPYKTSMPFSRRVYRGIKDLVSVVNEEGITLGGLRNARENLRTMLPLEATATEQAQISSLRKGLMDFMEQEVGTSISNPTLREDFKRYAINEGKRAEMEAIFGGKLDPASIRKTIRPEKVLDKVFKDTITVQTAKEILGEDVFNSALKNYLKLNMEAVTDAAKTGFSSNKFGSFLKKEAPQLTTAFGASPKQQMINDINTIMRILPDSGPVNPSMTAPTFQTLDKIAAIGGLSKLFSPVELTKSGLKAAYDAFITKGSDSALARHTITNIDRGMAYADAAKAAQEKVLKFQVLSGLESAVNKTSRVISKSVRNIISGAKTATPAIAGLVSTKVTKSPEEIREKFEKRTRQIQSLADSPEALSSTIQKATENVFEAAPQTAAGIQQTLVAGTQFLSSKIPRSPVAYPLQHFEPNDAEINKFNRYYDAVQNPLTILKEMEGGVLTKESLEAVHSVYPELYTSIQKEVLDQLSDVKYVPYQRRLMLAAFMQQPMDQSTAPESIVANQMAFMAQKNGQGQTEQSKVKSDLKAIDSIAGRTATDTQRAAQRKIQGQ